MVGKVGQQGSSRLNILITSISAKIQLVKSFKEVVEPLGGVVVGTDMDEKCCAADFVDVFAALPPDHSINYDAALLDVCVRHDIDLIIPSRDSELQRLTSLRHEFDALNIILPLPNADKLEICLDKKKFHRFCLNNGFPVLPLVDPAADVSFPLFVRAINTTEDKIAYQVPNLKLWEKLGLDRSHHICQPLCTDNEYSIDVLMDMDGEPLQAVVRHRQRLVNGESWRAQIKNMPELEVMAMDLCKKLELKAHNLVQAFVSEEGGIHLIEVNPRFGGCSNLSVVGGLNSPRRIVQMVQGNLEAAKRNGPIQFGLQSNRYSLDVMSRLDDD